MSSAPAFASLFEGRPPGRGLAGLLKSGRLALSDSSSHVLGVDESKMCATFVISSEDPDRVDDVVVTKGIYLTNFKKVPIAFYGHQVFPLPIGKWEDPDGNLCVWPRGSQTTGTYYSSQRSREAEQVFALVVEGILRATSIGFNPMEEPVPRDGRKANPLSLQRGYVFPKVDLLEVSIVGIPAQPTATLIRRALDKGRLAGWPIVPAIRKSLEPLAEPKPCRVNGGGFVSKKWGKTTPKGKVAETAPPPADEGATPDDAGVKAAAVAVDKATSSLAGPPPDSGNGVNGDAQQQQPQQPDPSGAGGKGDPKEVLNRLVDALADYLELTTQKGPDPGDEDEDDEDEEDDDDMADQQEDADDKTGTDRYEFRAAAPRRRKRGKYHASKLMGRVRSSIQECALHCKDVAEADTLSSSHKTAARYHHKELTSLHEDLTRDPESDGGGNPPPEDVGQGGGPDDGEHNAPSAPATTKQDVLCEVLDFDELDLDTILRELSPVKGRVAAVGNAWDALSGGKPT